jgi:protein-L-isoaspartate(D-aspartate) O-methyltransferase
MDTQVRIKFVLSLTIIMSLLLSPLIVGADETLFAQKRKQMVENQIKARGIKDLRVLDAMLNVKRHLFIPADIRHLAYEDRPLPIGGGQTISQPYIVALMTELLELKGTERVLEIGTGSGYQAAILAELAKEVYTIEILEPLARQSEGLLKEMNYKSTGVSP